jgi:hypothetical protein
VIGLKTSSEHITFTDFFNGARLPPVPPVIRHFCETMDGSLAHDDDTYKLLRLLQLAQVGQEGQEAAVDSFVVRLLETLGYASGHSHSQSSGSSLDHLRNITLSSDGLLVHEQKRFENPKDPQPQLIAEAIAAYQQNNLIRDRGLNLSPLDEITFPGITLVGTSPTFYKIKITTKLNVAVMGGYFPV